MPNWYLSQGMLGTQDLGQVYFEPIRDKHGNALLVLLKDMSACPNLDGVHWTQLCKLQLHRKSISSPEEPTALDMLLITLHVSIFFNGFVLFRGVDLLCPQQLQMVCQQWLGFYQAHSWKLFVTQR